MRWLEVKPDEPEEWQQAAQFGDTFMYAGASYPSWPSATAMADPT